MPIVFVSERAPGRRLYAADCKPLRQDRSKPQGSYVAVLLNGRCWRVTRSGGTIGTILVSPEALRKACGLQGMSVVLNEQKTPFHRTSVAHDQPFSAVRAVRDAIEGGDYDLSHPQVPTFEGYVAEALDVVAYHGTRYSPFQAVDLSYAGQTDDGYYGRGFYLSPDRASASEFGRHLLKAKVHMSKPLRLPSDSDMNSDSIIDARNILSKLPGMPASLRPNRQLPKGYRVETAEGVAWGNKTGQKVYYVAPDPSMYGTDKEVYGEERGTRDQAVVAFNDEMAGERGTWDAGWLFGLLRDIGRDRFVEALRRGGYDGVVVTDTKGRPLEYVVFDPRNVKVMGWTDA